jgi:hypothetical protein
MKKREAFDQDKVVKCIFVHTKSRYEILVNKNRKHKTPVAGCSRSAASGRR